jgi:hypothetical protein
MMALLLWSSPDFPENGNAAAGVFGVADFADLVFNRLFLAHQIAIFAPDFAKALIRGLNIAESLRVAFEFRQGRVNRLDLSQAGLDFGQSGLQSGKSAHLHPIKKAVIVGRGPTMTA